MQKHWLCVGTVTPAARKTVVATGGECIDLPTLHEDMPPLVLVFLKDELDLIFYDEGFHYVIGTSSNQIIGTLYSKNISQAFPQESTDDLILCSQEEWEVAWQTKTIG